LLNICILIIHAKTSQTYKSDNIFFKNVRTFFASMQVTTLQVTILVQVGAGGPRRRTLKWPSSRSASSSSVCWSFSMCSSFSGCAGRLSVPEKDTVRRQAVDNCLPSSALVSDNWTIRFSTTKANIVRPNWSDSTRPIARAGLRPNWA